ncbi:MAG: hypothetical protein Q9217_002502 [Psora testacea]
MPIIEVTPNNSRRLQIIADTIASAKKIVVVTGAGISTNCGIPDFRSEDGLYSLIQTQHKAASATEKAVMPETWLGLGESPPTISKPPCLPFVPSNIRGKDLFDAMILKDPASTSTFYKFMASLRKSIHEDVKQTTATHRFIRTLRDRKKLVRCYTQNIDGLEAREGLSTDLSWGKGTRTRFSKKSCETRRLPGGDMDGGCEVVQLHGDLKTLRCTLCQRICGWDPDTHSPRLLAGIAPNCQTCVATDQSRQDRGKRGTKVGTLRPNIVLYGEEHPSADAIGTIASHDLSMSPDLLLILGTSLHVHGLKVIVKEFAKSIHARAAGKGKVVFVNLSRPAESMWKDVIDYWVCLDCDDWVAKTRTSRPDVWQTQRQLEISIKKRQGSTKLQGKALKACYSKREEQDKENIIESEDSPTASSPRPKVVITAPAKGKIPFLEHDSNMTIPFKTPMKATEFIIPDPDPRFSLPTPPTSNSVTPISWPAKKRKPSTEAYRDECQKTPSKRLRSWFGIWAD